ncbi:hypothetical protein, partial [[Eubacterium] cellulosolvens]
MLLMASLTYEEIFKAATQILIIHDQRITITFTKDAVAIRFPTTRKLAEHLKTPHYYILSYFASMERDKLISRVERVGISTTQQGSRRLIEYFSSLYRDEVVTLLGRSLFD